ncbi:MAG: hypothetical protein V1918_08380 [Planctomycetota bacterium]
MHIILTDETNRRPSTSTKFFIYGGLLFPIERLSDLDARISKIRQTAGYQPTDEFKFDTRARPLDHVSFEACTEAKKQVIALCNELGCKFIAQVILHAIITNQDEGKQVQWAADYVIGRYNEYLKETNDDGICVVDNLPRRGEFRYLSDKFSKGLTLYTGTSLALNRIKLFASTCLGASHAASAMDIVLGSFRYCINDPKNQDAAREMIRQVVRMMWCKREGKRILLEDRGLILRPKLADITVASYKKEYTDLIDHLNSLLSSEA